MAAPRTGFTTRASCLFAAGLTAMLCGVVLGEVDLLRAGVLAAVIPCVASFVVQRAQLRIANRRAVTPSRAVAGESISVALTITNGGAFGTGTLMLEDQLPDSLAGNARFVLDSLRSRQARTVSYRIPTIGRGHYRAGPLRVRLTDPFGMIDLTRSFTAVSDVVVVPAVDPLPPASLPHSDDLGSSSGSHSVGAHGADDASTREYRVGDDLRKIHWRSTARTGAVMVRQEEQPWRGQTTVLLDLRRSAHVITATPQDFADRPGSADEPVATSDPRTYNSLEWAVSAAASVGTQIITTGQRFGLVTEAARRVPISFDQPASLLDHLASVRDIADVDLGVLNTLTRDAALVAILGRLDETAMSRLISVTRRGGSLTLCALLLDIDTWVPGTPATPRTPVTGGTPVETSAALLRSAGWSVAVARRGQSIPDAWQTTILGSRHAVGR